MRVGLHNRMSTNSNFWLFSVLFVLCSVSVSAQSNFSCYWAGNRGDPCPSSCGLCYNPGALSPGALLTLSDAPCTSMPGGGGFWFPFANEGTPQHMCQKQCNISSSCSGCTSCSFAQNCASTVYCSSSQTLNNFQCTSSSGVISWSASCAANTPSVMAPSTTPTSSASFIQPQAIVAASLILTVVAHHW